MTQKNKLSLKNAEELAVLVSEKSKDLVPSPSDRESVSLEEKHIELQALEYLKTLALDVINGTQEHLEFRKKIIQALTVDLGRKPVSGDITNVLIDGTLSKVIEEEIAKV